MDFGNTIPSRTTDPETSHMAEKNVKLRAGTQRAILLSAYEDINIPLIDEEAMTLSGANPRSCWWRRCSDLRDDGYIEWFYITDEVPYKKKSSLGELCRASVITEKGKKALQEMRAS